MSTHSFFNFLPHFTSSFIRPNPSSTSFTASIITSKNTFATFFNPAPGTTYSAGAARKQRQAPQRHSITIHDTTLAAPTNKPDDETGALKDLCDGRFPEHEEFLTPSLQEGKREVREMGWNRGTTIGNHFSLLIVGNKDPFAGR